MSVAVINLGGKQYIATPGKIISVAKLPQKEGETLSLADKLSGKKVTAEILSHAKGDKIRVVKFKNKTRYFRSSGARASLTHLAIKEIE